MTNSMTNYNERLDKILLSHGAEQGELHYSLKQALTALIKELVADAKPAHIHGTTASSGQFNRGVSEFEQNLLKALETQE